MSRGDGKKLKAHLEPVGLGAGWSNPLRIDRLGRAGEVVNFEIRGDPTDATAGTMTLMLFEAPIPLNPSDYVDLRTVLLAKMNPATIPDDDQALRVSGLTVAASATVSSDKVNVRDDTEWSALYSIVKASNGLYLAILGVTGKVHVTIRAQGG